MAKTPKTVEQEVPLQKNLDVSIYWIKERESIRRKKEAGKPAPWTKDQGMAQTRWCNVRRMDDKVSKWLLNNFYQNTKKMSPAAAAVAATMARVINRPETLERLCPEGFKNFKYKAFSRILREMKENGEQIFTGVYIVNGANAQGRSKWQLVLDNIQDMADKITDEEIDTTSMEKTHANLMKYPGLGSFIAGQVVADLRHIVKGTWADRNDWAPQGPGSARGLNFVFNTPGQKMNQARFQQRLAVYIKAVNKDPEVRKITKDRGLEAHDFQNCLCETSKMARLLKGGRAKNRYVAAQQMDLDL